MTKMTEKTLSSDSTTSRTLYVTDLDGTLMRDDKTISPETARIFNNLISLGVNLTYATARSNHSASEITKDIHFKTPVILLNGTIISNPETNTEIEIAKFTKYDLQRIKEIVARNSQPYLSTRYEKGNVLNQRRNTAADLNLQFLTKLPHWNVRSRGRNCNPRMLKHSADYNFGECKKRYLQNYTGEGFEAYLKLHEGDKRMMAVQSEDELYEGDVCYFTFIAEKSELEPLYNRLKNIETISCVFQKDKYRAEYWLEICPENATKASAIQKLKERCDCERLVVFGDSLNDIPMFECADECYAVGNAMPEVKKIATGIIGDNNSDGVAKWLEENAK